jgi:hypothetical protein
MNYTSYTVGHGQLREQVGLIFRSYQHKIILLVCQDNILRKAKEGAES